MENKKNHSHSSSKKPSDLKNKSEKPKSNLKTEAPSESKISSLLLKKKQNSALSKLKKEKAELQKSYRYLQAEFANYKRISLKEKQDTIKYAVSSCVQDLLLNVLNDFNRAIEIEWKEKDFEHFKKGIEIIHSQFIKHLKKHGVEEINPQKAPFDPHFHEILGTEKKQDIPAHTIIRVCRKGYKIDNRLIQPAQVIVSKIE